MKKLTKNKPLLLTIVGLAIMALSILWEYVRVRPDYRFVIEPWSQRGYEIDQGLVIALGAILIAVIAVLLAVGLSRIRVAGVQVAARVPIAIATMHAGYAWGMIHGALCFACGRNAWQSSKRKMVKLSR